MMGGAAWCFEQWMAFVEMNQIARSRREYILTRVLFSIGKGELNAAFRQWSRWVRHNELEYITAEVNELRMQTQELMKLRSAEIEELHELRIRVRIQEEAVSGQ